MAAENVKRPVMTNRWPLRLNCAVLIPRKIGSSNLLLPPLFSRMSKTKFRSEEQTSELQSTFVGEPTGSRPNHYGEADKCRLGLVLQSRSEVHGGGKRQAACNDKQMAFAVELRSFDSSQNRFKQLVIAAIVQPNVQNKI